MKREGGGTSKELLGHSGNGFFRGKVFLVEEGEIRLVFIGDAEIVGQFVEFQSAQRVGRIGKFVEARCQPFRTPGEAESGGLGVYLFKRIARGARGGGGGGEFGG